MQATIFAKNMTSSEGKSFKRFITKLTKKDGEEVTMNVKFRSPCEAPKEFPCNIVFDKTDANISEKLDDYTDAETGEAKQSLNRVLWVSAYTLGEPYVDTSLDDYE